MESIIQWNINGYYTHLEQLKLIINEYTPIVISLQETNFKGEHSPKIQGYTCYVKNRESESYASGGVALLINDHIDSNEIHLDSEIEAIAAELNGPNKICVCSIYLPNSSELNLAEIQHLITQLPRPFILMGHFNSHHTLWESHKIDRRGKIIEKLLDNDPDITLINISEYTHFNISNGSSSAIDLTIVSIQIMLKTKWNVLPDLHDSDHFPININIETGTRINANYHIPKWRLNKADWEKYRSIITNTLAEDNMKLTLET